MNFWKKSLGRPLSAALNSDEWNNSVLARLAKETGEKVYVLTVDAMHQSYPIPQESGFIWRPVYAYWKNEDNLMTKFECYGPDGQHLPHATVGISWGQMGQDTGGEKISGYFQYPLQRQLQYLPTDGHFTTVNQGGYVAQVLDHDYPSEGIAFGYRPDPDGEGHQVLVVGFQLLPRGGSGRRYPNDYFA